MYGTNGSRALAIATLNEIAKMKQAIAAGYDLYINSPYTRPLQQKQERG
jgi:hypothetical protein